MMLNEIFASKVVEKEIDYPNYHVFIRKMLWFEKFGYMLPIVVKYEYLIQKKGSLGGIGYDDMCHNSIVVFSDEKIEDVVKECMKRLEKNMWLRIKEVVEQ